MISTNWTTEQLDILHRDWPAGVAAREIAANIGIAMETVQNKAGTLKLRRPVQQSEAWPLDTEKKFIAMLDAGYSRSQAGRELGVSRNAAIAKARRMGWEPPPPEKPRGLMLADLQPKDCRYPYGDRTPYTFCGNRVQEGSSYCRSHHQLCNKHEAA